MGQVKAVLLTARQPLLVPLHGRPTCSHTMLASGHPSIQRLRECPSGPYAPYGAASSTIAGGTVSRSERALLDTGHPRAINLGVVRIEALPPAWSGHGVPGQVRQDLQQAERRVVAEGGGPAGHRDELTHACLIYLVDHQCHAVLLLQDLHARKESRADSGRPELHAMSHAGEHGVCVAPDRSQLRRELADRVALVATQTRGWVETSQNQTSVGPPWERRTPMTSISA